MTSRSESSIPEPFFAPMDTEAQLRTKVRRVHADGETFAELSCSEQIAVALILDRLDLLERTYGTMLESIDRLGPEWTEAALRVQRRGW
jgi:hypothetical protein